MALKRTLAIVALMLGAAALGYRSGVPDAAAPGIRLRAMVDAQGHARFELVGLDDELLAGFRAARPSNHDWEGSFPLQPDGADSTRPAMAGRYLLAGDRLVFTPAYPLLPGVDYVATANLKGLAELAGCLHRPGAGMLVLHARISPPTLPSKAFVMRVYPTADSLPANLLKFYIYFSQPMRTGEVMDHLLLLDEDGRAVTSAFLATDELWDRSYRRLTVLLDPGRIKRGLRPNQELGTPLTPGHRYQLRIDPTWHDASGAFLSAPYEKSFVAVEPDRASPDIRAWQIAAPVSGTLDPIAIRLPEPLDHALTVRLIGVSDPSGSAVPVRITTTDNDRTVRLTPHAPWTAGVHQVVVGTELEDLAGNTFGRLFDTDLRDPSAQPNDDSLPLAIPVVIAPGPGAATRFARMF